MENTYSPSTEHQRVEKLIADSKTIFIDTALYMRNEPVRRAWEVHLQLNIPLEDAMMIAIPALLEEIRILKEQKPSSQI